MRWGEVVKRDSDWLIAHTHAIGAPYPYWMGRGSASCRVQLECSGIFLSIESLRGRIKGLYL